MKIGTKSLLFGVHQFLLHPIVVGHAWKRLYKRWPNSWEWLAIIVHDWGYWGMSDMDGLTGKMHPMRSATLAYHLARRWWNLKHLFHPRLRKARGAAEYYAFECAMMVRHHSREMVKLDQRAFTFLRLSPSPLCWPDKFSIFYEWEWFYLFRAGLTGELAEYVANAKHSGHIPPDATNRQWLNWYKGYTYRAVCKRNNPDPCPACSENGEYHNADCAYANGN